MARAAATVRAYDTDWATFAAWCATHGVGSLPAAPTTVARYLDELAPQRSVATLRRRLAAVRAAHVDRGHPSPTDTAPVRLAVAKAEWRQRARQVTTTPLGIEELRAVSRATPDTPAGARDRALLLLGYGAGLRPGELADLDADQVQVVTAGLRVAIRRRCVLVPFGSAPELCAVQAWTRWRATAGLVDGPAFRPIDRHGRIGDGRLAPKAVTRVVRRAATRAGLEATRYRGLSLRRGMVTAATEHGVSDARIMAQTGHRSRRLVRRYMLDG
jgi:integrase